MCGLRWGIIKNGNGIIESPFTREALNFSLDESRQDSPDMDLKMGVAGGNTEGMEEGVTPLSLLPGWDFKPPPIPHMLNPLQSWNLKQRSVFLVSL